MPLDTLRPPFSFDPSAPAYKDWFHLNFADPTSDVIGLVNVSLHGSPSDDRARAVGTVLVHSPEDGWASHVEVLSYSEANIGVSSVGLRDVAVAIDQSSGAIHVSVAGTSLRLRSHLLAVPVSRPFEVADPMPLGSGWISWYLVPRMNISADWDLTGKASHQKHIAGYHDHNWGRWHWGDDFGWEWGCFLGDPLQPRLPSVVFARTSDRAHKNCGKPFLLVDMNNKQKRFAGDEITAKVAGQFKHVLHRVPGAMAALHQEMAEPDLPAGIELSATHGSDRLQLSFEARAGAQLITADPVLRGYGFIHELVGKYTCSGCLGGTSFEAGGHGVFEYVV